MSPNRIRRNFFSLGFSIGVQFVQKTLKTFGELNDQTEKNLHLLTARTQGYSEPKEQPRQS